MNRQVGLGRGLSALIPAAQQAGDTLRTIPLSMLRPNPRQPRQGFDEQALEELAKSIAEVGLLQPVLVRHVRDDLYELIAGERRLRAAQRAGLAEIPAIVRQTDDEHLLTEALVENIHRTDLNPLEEAAAYRQLLDDFGMTHEELAERIGRSRSAISNALRLLSLPPVLQHKLAVGSLTTGHARALLALDDADRQQRVAQRVIGEGLSVRATEELVRSLLEERDQLQDLERAARQRRSSPYAHLQERLTDALATKVRITGSDRRGRVVINYSGREDLERLLHILGRGSGEDLLT